MRKYTNLNVTMPIIGVGIEGQHPLYRYVYMFAAIDVRVGYGGSTIDSTIAVTMPDNMIPRPYYGNMTIITDKSGPIAHMLYAGIATYPGIKVQLKRIAAGLDFPFLVFFTDVLKTSKADYENSGFSFSIGLFANYRF